MAPQREEGNIGFSAGPPERNIHDVRDYKIADLEMGASTASFEKWKHDLELFVDHWAILVRCHESPQGLPPVQGR